MPPADVRGILIPASFDAVLFDLDGVLTATARLHAAAWKKMFDQFLRGHAAGSELPFREFDLDNNYKLYVDGKPRTRVFSAFSHSEASTCRSVRLARIPLSIRSAASATARMS